MTNPNDPQGENPQPTEQFGSPPRGQTPGHTSDPTFAYGQAGYQQPHYPQGQYPQQGYDQQAYGQGYKPTEAIPTYDQYGQQYPTQQYPGQPYAGQPNATQQYPTQYGQQYGPPGGPPPGAVEAPFLESPGGGPGGSKVWMYVVGAIVVIALVAAGAFALFSSSPSDSETAAPLTTRSLPSQAPPTLPSTESTFPPLDQIPGLEQLPGGLGEAMGNSGSAIGTIRTNDGTTLVLDAIGGSTVTVVTNEQTEIVSLTGGTVADLAPGSSIVVQGTPLDESGSITAQVIVSTSFGN